MNDTYITLVGNVTADPRRVNFNDGTRVTSLRLASTRRVFDRSSQTWHDGETTFYSVRCYRTLAENVAQSIKLGQPIVVHGRLRIRSYERDGERRFVAEVEATSVGHDLRRGVSTFERPQRGPAAPAFDEVTREPFADTTRDWELIGAASPAATDGQGGRLRSVDSITDEQRAGESGHTGNAAAPLTGAHAPALADPMDTVGEQCATGDDMPLATPDPTDRLAA